MGGNIIICFQFINYLYSLHDCDVFQSLNFSAVSEAMITASIANSKIPDQKVARHRVLQCIKYRPSLRGIAAWVLCNKGGHLSPSFARVLTQALQVSGSQLQLSHDIAALIFQVGAVFQTNFTMYCCSKYCNAHITPVKAL